jgi:hypothetical protein
MAENLVEVDQFDANVSVPEGGDVRNAASVRSAFQSLANRGTYVKNRALGVKSAFQYGVPLGAPLSNVGFTFGIDSGPGNDAIGFEQSGTSSPQLWFALDNWGPGIKVTSLFARYRVKSSHADLLPAFQPRVSLFRQPVDGGTAVTVGTAQDNAGSSASYEAAGGRSIELVLGGGGHVFVAGSSYYVRFEGESSTNSEAGLTLTNIELLLSPG